MKRKPAKQSDDDLLPEYDFSQVAGGVRGKYAARYREETSVVVLTPDEGTRSASMSYSDFTLESVGSSLGISTAQATLFPQLTPIAIPHELAEALAKRTPLSLISEKARSEFIVVPILQACRAVSHDRLAIFSGQRLDVDPGRGLAGECDFILADAPPVPPLRAPILTVVEAKKNDIELGLGQCIAQMVAASMFNRAAGRASIPVHGCVTTGEVWQFLRLADSTALIDDQRFYLDNVGLILAAVQAIVAQADAK